MTCGAGYTIDTDDEVRRGRPNLSSHYATVGLQRHGGLAQYVTVPAEICVDVRPYGLGDDGAALAQPVAIAVHSMRRGRLQPGEQALVIGAGGIGVFLLYAAVELGARVAVADLDETRLGIARDLGAHELIDAREGPLPELLAARGIRPDVIYEVTGTDAGLKSAITSAPNGSRVVLVGPPRAPPRDRRPARDARRDRPARHQRARLRRRPAGGGARAGDAAAAAGPTSRRRRSRSSSLLEEGILPLVERRATRIKTLIDPVGGGAAGRDHGQRRALVDGPRVGFLGLGRMGTAMARRLAGAGLLAAVWNRSPQAAAGAGRRARAWRRARRPADVARASDVVITMLSDGAAVDAVARGPDGLAGRPATGRRVGRDEHHRPRARRRARAQLVAARGAAFVDAPGLRQRRVGGGRDADDHGRRRGEARWSGPGRRCEAMGADRAPPRRPGRGRHHEAGRQQPRLRRRAGGRRVARARRGRRHRALAGLRRDRRERRALARGRLPPAAVRGPRGRAGLVQHGADRQGLRARSSASRRSSARACRRPSSTPTSCGRRSRPGAASRTSRPSRRTCGTTERRAPCSVRLRTTGRAVPSPWCTRGGDGRPQHGWAAHEH